MPVVRREVVCGQVLDRPVGAHERDRHAQLRPWVVRPVTGSGGGGVGAAADAASMAATILSRATATVAEPVGETRAQGVTVRAAPVAAKPRSSSSARSSTPWASCRATPASSSRPAPVFSTSTMVRVAVRANEVIVSGSRCTPPRYWSTRPWARRLSGSSAFHRAAQTSPSGSVSVRWPTAYRASSTRTGGPNSPVIQVSRPSRSASARAARDCGAVGRVLQRSSADGSMSSTSTPSWASCSRSTARYRSAVSRCSTVPVSRGQPPDGVASTRARPAQASVLQTRVGLLARRRVPR